MIWWLVFWGLVATGVFGGRFFLRLLYPVHYSGTVRQYAAANNLDPLLVHALIRVESRYNPRARSPKGALGLMQLMPDTARWFAEKSGETLPNTERLYDPELNIRYGTGYFRDLMQEFGNRLPVALAAYNAGRGNVRRWLENDIWDGTLELTANIPFPETRAYVGRIYEAWAWYQRLYADDD